MDYGYPGSSGGNLTAEYVLTTMDPTLFNSKVLTPGPGITITVDATTVTVSAAGGGSGALESYFTFDPEAGLINSRQMLFGTNINTTDAGAGSTFQIQVLKSSSDTTGTYTLTSASLTTRFADASGGNIDYNLPNSNAGNKDKIYTIKRIDNSGNYVSINRTGSNLIDGSAASILLLTYQSYSFQADGNGNWFIL